MIYKFSVRTTPAAGISHDGLAARWGLSNLQVWRDYYIEAAAPLTPEKIELLRQSLGNGLTEEVTHGETLPAGRAVQVAYKRGIVDNENDSLVDLCELLGITALAGKVATTYESSDPNLLAAITAHACNPNIEEIHTAEPHYETLQPAGFFQPMQTFDLRALSDEQLAALGKAEGRNLDLSQMQLIRTIQLETGAPHVTDVLLEAMDARWSDHCAHTTWRSLGNLLKLLIKAAENTNNPNIVSMFHDNAGVWDFYDGQCLAFKAETHNGPTAISAYFGQLTKLGGVLRDVLGTGQGADPIGVFEYTATGEIGSPSPIPGRPNSQQIAVETIRAIKEYGNTFGTPMMWSHMTQHSKYRAKPFALGGCIGILPKAAAQRGVPEPGDMLMLIGGLTGNDGIHGASASSAGSEMDTASVQIGSPLEEVKFRQAILDLRDAGCIRAITDMGAAGLNSAVGEMGDPCGVWLNTALVPLKTKGLAQWRILLSESQERMLLAISPAKLDEARKILHRHRVRHAVVGRFTGTGNYTVVHNPKLSEQFVVVADHLDMPLDGELGIDAPYALLKYVPPSITPEPPPRKTLPTCWPKLAAEELPAIVERLLADGELFDQTFAGNQYDSTVMGHSYYGPYTRGADHQACPTSAMPTTYWAGKPIYGQPQAAVFNTAFNPWLFEVNPRVAARQCFLAALTGQVLAGVKIEDICLCDNFYTPHREVGAHWHLAEMVRELAELVEKFRTPMISGKDSSAGSVDTPEGLISVPPAVFISALGKVPDASQLLPNEWKSPGNLLVRIGPKCVSAAGTVAARLLQLDANDADGLSPDDHFAFLKAVEKLPRGAVVSGVPLGTGGVLAAAIRGSLASGYGVELKSPTGGLHELMQEHRCGALIEIPAVELQKLSPALSPEVVGQIITAPQTVLVDGQNVLTAEAIATWKKTYREILN